MSAQITNCAQCCNIKKLQIQDLNLKIEALEHKNKTMTLENSEYVKRMDEMKQQNEELKFALESNEKRITEEIEMFSPILEYANKTMESITEDESQISELEYKLNEYEKSMQLLQSENINLHKENEKFRTVLELNYKQKQMQKIMLVAKNKTIDSLKSKIQELHDELQTVETVHYSTPKTPQIHYDTPFPDTAIQSDSVQALYFLKSIDESDNPTLASVFGGIGSNNSSISTDVDSLQFVIHAERSSLDSINENNNMNELKSKLETLMMENQQLIKQIDILEDNNIESKYMEESDEKYDTNIGSSIIEEEQEHDEFDEDDMFEMEQLFRKCEEEMMKSGYDVYEKVNSHKRSSSLSWWLHYESTGALAKMGK
eukprot:343809_1